MQVLVGELGTVSLLLSAPCALLPKKDHPLMQHSSARLQDSSPKAWDAPLLLLSLELLRPPLYFNFKGLLLVLVLSLPISPRLAAEARRARGEDAMRSVRESWCRKVLW